MNICAYCEGSTKNVISVANRRLIKIWNEMINKNHSTELLFLREMLQQYITLQKHQIKHTFKKKWNYILSENQCGMCLTPGLTTGRLMQEFEIQFLKKNFHLAVTTDDRIYICTECQNVCVEIESRLLEDDCPSPASTPPLESNPPTPRDVSTQPSTTAYLRCFKNKRTSLYIKSLLNRHKKTFKK